MTQYKTLIVKLSNSQLNKLKSGIKEGTGLTLNLSSNVIGDSNDETDFPNKLLLTNTQVSRICKAFTNSLSANIKLSKIQLSRIAQSGGFFLIINNLRVPIMRASLEITSIGDRIAGGKSVPEALLDAGSNPFHNKFNIKPLSLLKGSGITQTSNMR